MDALRLLLFPFFLLILAYGAAQSNVTHTIIHDTVQRSFIVHKPTGYSGNHPVSCVFNLHGAGMSASYQQLYSKMDAVSNANGFLVVYPQGIDNAWLTGSAGIYSETARDVAFISAVLDTLQQLYNIDETRVFACGLSQGGFMSHRLASDLQDRFAATASVAGAMSDSAMVYCGNSRNVPVLLINGTDDPYVSYSWAEETAAFWTAHNSCGSMADTTDLPNSNVTDNSTVKHIVYSNCENDAAVEMFSIEGGGHTWPSPFISLSGYGSTNYDISASQEIWKFFNRFSIHGSVAAVAEQQTQTFKVYPNPVSDLLRIAGELPVDLRILDVRGTVVLEAKQVNEVDVSGIAAGIYHVQVGREVVKITVGL